MTDPNRACFCTRETCFDSCDEGTGCSHGKCADLVAEAEAGATALIDVVAGALFRDDRLWFRFTDRFSELGSVNEARRVTALVATEALLGQLLPVIANDLPDVYEQGSSQCADGWGNDSETITRWYADAIREMKA
jgi:hypothetical protein